MYHDSSSSQRAGPAPAADEEAHKQLGRRLPAVVLPDRRVHEERHRVRLRHRVRQLPPRAPRLRAGPAAAASWGTGGRECSLSADGSNTSACARRHGPDSDGRTLMGRQGAGGAGRRGVSGGPGVADGGGGSLRRRTGRRAGRAVTGRVTPSRGGSRRHGAGHGTGQVRGGWEGALAAQDVTTVASPPLRVSPP